MRLEFVNTKERIDNVRQGEEGIEVMTRLIIGVRSQTLPTKPLHNKISRFLDSPCLQQLPRVMSCHLPERFRSQGGIDGSGVFIPAFMP